jgi:hypothetical protein
MIDEPGGAGDGWRCDGCGGCDGFDEMVDLGVGGGGVNGEADPAGFGGVIAGFEAIEDGVGSHGVDVQ